MFSFIPAKRGKGQNLVYENFVYKKNKTTTVKTYFTCVQKECTSRLIMDAGCTTMLKEPTDHFHDEDSDMIETERFRQGILQAIDNDPTKRMKELYDQQLEAFAQDT